MKKRLPIALFIFLALIQLAWVIMPVLKREYILRTGTAFKFRLEPVDPYDAFAGRYLEFSYALERTAPEFASLGKDLEDASWANVHFVTDADGFAAIDKITAAKPKDQNYVRIRYHDAPGIRLPFNRYYIDEDQAPAAEKAWAAARRIGGISAYALVRIRSGQSVIENLYLDGMPLPDYLRKAH